MDDKYKNQTGHACQQQYKKSINHIVQEGYRHIELTPSPVTKSTLEPLVV